MIPPGRAWAHYENDYPLPFLPIGQPVGQITRKSFYQPTPTRFVVGCPAQNTVTYPCDAGQDRRATYYLRRARSVDFSAPKLDAASTYTFPTGMPTPRYSGGPLHAPSVGHILDDTTAACISGDVKQSEKLMRAVANVLEASQVFAKWYDQLKQYEGARDKEGSKAIFYVHELRSVSSELEAKTRTLLRAYKSLAHLTVERLRSIAAAGGGYLFESGLKGDDKLLRINREIKLLLTDLSNCGKKMQAYIRALTDVLQGLRWKYGSSRKQWAWFGRAFQTMFVLLEVAGVASNVFFPLGTISNLALAVSAKGFSAAGAVMDKVGDEYETEIQLLQRISDFLHKVTEIIWCSRATLKGFDGPRNIFKEQKRVMDGESSGFMSAREAQKALKAWRNAEDKLGWNLCGENAMKRLGRLGDTSSCSTSMISFDL